MKLGVAYLLFCFSGIVFTFADYIVQFTDPVKKILEKVKDIKVFKGGNVVKIEELSGKFSIDTSSIHDTECRKFVRYLFKKDGFEYAPIYAKILLENENESLLCAGERLVIMQLLQKINAIFLNWCENFEMTCEQARGLEYSFRETMQLIDPLYH